MFQAAAKKKRKSEVLRNDGMGESNRISSDEEGESDEESESGARDDVNNGDPLNLLARASGRAPEDMLENQDMLENRSISPGMDGSQSTADLDANGSRKHIIKTLITYRKHLINLVINCYEKSNFFLNNF